MAGFQHGQVKRLVAGDNRRAAVLPVLFEVGEEGGGGGGIEGGQRFVKQPQRRGVKPEAGELTAALLAGGKLAALPVIVAVQGDGGERGIKARLKSGVIHAVVEAGGVAQVFARGEGGFDAGTVAEVEVRRVAADGAALRGDEAGERL